LGVAYFVFRKHPPFWQKKEKGFLKKRGNEPYKKVAAFCCLNEALKTNQEIKRAYLMGTPSGVIGLMKKRGDGWGEIH